MKKRDGKGEALSKEEQKIISPLEKVKVKSFIIKAAIVLSVLIVIFAILFFIFSKVSITLTNELNIIITPVQQSKALNNSETATLEFEIKNDNLLQCAASCKFELFSPINSTPISSTFETLSHAEVVKKSFEVSLPAKGSGQEIYAFKATCHNYRSVLCLTDEEERIARAVAIVNYNLRDEEKIAKATFKEKIEALITLANTSKVQLDKIPKKSIPAGTIEGNALKKEIAEEEKSVQEALLLGSKLTQLWEFEEYLRIQSEFNDTLLESAETSNNRIESTISNFEQLMLWRNSNANILIKVQKNTAALKDLKEFYELEENPFNDEKLSVAANASQTIYESYLLIRKNITHSEEAITANLDQSSAVIYSALADYNSIRANISFLILYSNNLLAIKNSNHSNSELNCKGLIQARQAIETDMNITTTNSSDKVDLDDNYNKSMAYAKEIALNATISQAQEMRLQDSEKIIELAKARQANITSYMPTNEELSRLKFEYSELDQAISRYCKTPAYTNLFDGSSIELISRIEFAEALLIPLEINLTPQAENIYLRDNPSICCSLGTCNPCCDSPECTNKDYPILLIHGHAFNNKASPEFSLTLFSELQEKLESDGIASFGKLELEEMENSQETTWGRQPRPISFKTSYYYISHYSVGDYVVSVQNDESIENYAIRLKEIIENVKEKTGKKKINLVAHSMGGLVAREYIYLFGEGSVNKLITINTPHKGMSGRTKDWCTLLGSSKECEEMAEGSIFLSRLNSRKLPAGLKAYAIRSTGCRMENGAEGDGVVLYQNAVFDGAEVYTIHGNCTDALQSSLHNDILSPTRYPQAYDIITNILSK